MAAGLVSCSLDSGRFDEGWNGDGILKLFDNPLGAATALLAAGLKGRAEIKPVPNILV